MKYKICKLVDGNGAITYQIKTKGWLFWRWVCAAAGPLDHNEPLDFFTFEQADFIFHFNPLNNHFTTSLGCLSLNCSQELRQDLLWFHLIV